MREKSRILTRGQRAPRGNSAQMWTDYYHNHLFPMLWWQWWGFNACMFLFHYLSVLNLLAELKLSVSPH